MTRPTKNAIDSGIQGWEGKIDDNDSVLFNGPIPIHEHVGDQTDLEATFAAAAFDRCFIWVNHTSVGWTLYVSDGTDWEIDDARIHEYFTFTSTTSMLVAHRGAFIHFTGTGTVDFDLEPAANWIDQMVILRNDKTSGTMNLDPNGSENINGVSGGPLTLAIGSTATLFSNGTEIFVGVQS